MSPAWLLGRAFYAGAALLERAASALERGAHALASVPREERARANDVADDQRVDSPPGPPQVWLDRLADAGLAFDAGRIVPVMEEMSEESEGSEDQAAAAPPDMPQGRGMATPRESQSESPPADTGSSQRTTPAESNVDRREVVTRTTRLESIAQAYVRPTAAPHGTTPAEGITEAETAGSRPRPTLRPVTRSLATPAPAGNLPTVSAPTEPVPRATARIAMITPREKPWWHGRPAAGEVHPTTLDESAPAIPRPDLRISIADRSRPEPDRDVAALRIRKNYESAARASTVPPAPIRRDSRAADPASIAAPLDIEPDGPVRPSNVPFREARSPSTYVQHTYLPRPDVAADSEARRWPELPDSDRLMPGETAINVLRRQRRLDRLDREQRGETWSESLF